MINIENSVKKIEFISNIKVISVMMVIFLHSYSALCYSFPYLKTSEFYNAVFLDTLVRPCVPLFLIVNGVSLLSKDYKLTAYLKDKILLRLTVPYIFYGILYCILIHKPFKFLLSPGEICFHFYFFLLILTCYLVYPIIRIFAKFASKDHVIYIGILFLTLTIIKSPYFGGLVLVYPVMGYFINKLDLKHIKYFAFCCYVLFVIITFILTIYASEKSDIFIEEFFEYFQLNIILMSFSLFLFLKYLPSLASPPPIINLRNFIEKHTYGIYYLHPLIQRKFYVLYDQVAYIHGVIIFIATFLITCLIFGVFDLITSYLKIDKYTKYITG